MHRKWKWALVMIAALGTVAAIVLAAYPGLVSERTQYDPGLAVLTATLIVVIWSTVATAWAATHKEPTVLLLKLGKNGNVLMPALENPTRRTVKKVALEMRIWVCCEDDCKEVAPSAFYRGDDPFPIGPTGSFRGHVDLLRDFDFKAGPGNVPTPKQNEIRAMLRACWTDDLGASGTVGWRFYRVARTSDDVVSVVAQDNIDRWFPETVRDAPVPHESRRISPAHGFRHDETDAVHRLRHLFRDPWRHAKVGGDPWETADGTRRAQVQIGSGYATVGVHPDDIHGALFEWVATGADAVVVYIPDMEREPHDGVRCRLMMDDAEVVRRPGWNDQTVRMRLAPTDTIEELLHAMRRAVDAD